jgi:hypothetical protein
MIIEKQVTINLTDLKTLVEHWVDQRLQTVAKPAETRTIETINQAIRQNRWTPPPEAPSVVESLRDDRDR